MINNINIIFINMMHKTKYHNHKDTYRIEYYRTYPDNGQFLNGSYTFEFDQKEIGGNKKNIY